MRSSNAQADFSFLRVMSLSLSGSGQLPDSTDEVRYALPKNESSGDTDQLNMKQPSPKRHKVSEGVPSTNPAPTLEAASAHEPAEPLPEFDGFPANYFDRILLDPPCSGLGTTAE